MSQTFPQNAGRDARPNAGPTVAPVLTPTALGPIEHTDIGHGPALLALHGGMGGHDQSLLLARALLAEPASRRVIAVSRPGYLGTPRAADDTFADHADQLAALLDQLGIETATVAAVSAGGPTAIAFAARHADRCSGLILVSTPTGKLDSPGHVLKRLRQFRILCAIPALPRLLGWLPGWLNDRDPDKAATRAIRDAELRRRTLAHPAAGPLLRALQRSVFDRMPARLPGTIADTEALADLSPLPLAEISSPTLVIHGEADAIVPFAHAARAGREIAGADLLAITAGEHVSLFTHLDAVRARVARFLAGLDG